MNRLLRVVVVATPLTALWMGVRPRIKDHCIGTDLYFSEARDLLLPPFMSETSDTQFVESDHEFFELTGPLPTAWDEHRRFPRFYYRSCAEAIVYPLRSGKSATQC